MLRDRGGQGPVLVCVHGFLGSAADWDAVLPELQRHFHCYTVDLPGHGQTSPLQQASLSACADLLYQTLQHYQLLPAALLGYSLGGRICLTLAQQHPELVTTLILEGANPGLTDTSDKRQRFNNDQAWAERFASQPLSQVLAQWYRQPVFGSLSPEQRELLVAERGRQASGAALAGMLSGCSLATQPEFWSWLRQPQCPVVYIAGQQDTRFCAIAAKLQASCMSHSGPQLQAAYIPDAGHNAHRDNPRAFVTGLIDVVQNVQRQCRSAHC